MIFAGLPVGSLAQAFSHMHLSKGQNSAVYQEQPIRETNVAKMTSFPRKVAMLFDGRVDAVTGESTKFNLRSVSIWASSFGFDAVRSLFDLRSFSWAIRCGRGELQEMVGLKSRVQV